MSDDLVRQLRRCLYDPHTGENLSPKVRSHVVAGDVYLAVDYIRFLHAALAGCPTVESERDANAFLTEEVTRLEDENARLRNTNDWHDYDDEWTPQIDAAHPVNTKSNDEHWACALDLVGSRRSKGSLVDLVGWLLAENARLRGALRGASEQVRFVADAAKASYRQSVSATGLESLADSIEVTARAAITKAEGKTDE